MSSSYDGDDMIELAIGMILWALYAAIGYHASRWSIDKVGFPMPVLLFIMCCALVWPFLLGIAAFDAMDEVQPRRKN